MRGDMGVFAVIGTALMFLAFAAMAAGIASRPDPEDGFYNQYILLPSALQSFSDGVSVCAGYAITQSLDHSSDPHHRISSVSSSDFTSYFNSCISTLSSRLVTTVSSLGPSLTLTPHVIPACASDCSTVNISGPVQYSFTVDSNVAGLELKKTFSGTLPIQKTLTVTPTGQIWVGDPSTPADDRNVYRILVRDDLLGRVDVNGIWPR